VIRSFRSVRTLLAFLLAALATVALPPSSLDAQQARGTRKPAASASARKKAPRARAGTRAPRAAARDATRARGRAKTRAVAARPVRRAPAVPMPTATTPVGVDALRADLSSMLGTGARSGSWSAMVVSLSAGDTLLSVTADSPHLPASTMKLLTATLALDRLGANHRFRTELLHTGTIRDGVLEGDLVLRGDGDPSLSTRFLGASPDAAMDSIAQLVVRRGVRRVTGRVVGDASAFEARATPEGWLPRILEDSYAGKVSALSLNEGIVWVMVRPVGGRAQVTLEPASVALPVSAAVRVTGGAGATLSVRRTGNTVVVRGSIGARAGQRAYGLVIPDPASFTTGALVAALQRAGVETSGQWAVAPAPAGAIALGALESQPVETLVTVMNRQSVNPIAEHLLRAAVRGPDRNAVGSAVGAERMLQDVLRREAGVNPSAVQVRDGSGLSTLDRISARAMVQMLGWADKAPWRSLFHASLPLAGESGTLRGRMRGTAAAANLHAKTGTTNDVVSLAGYVTARNGELLAFALLYNGADRWRARSAIDAVGATLADFTR
jgi:D-alanyl-D-alanine carboxypeptidase/D-alanyl-D-alanine-endopeptidase (penicillin-binding protein 4)